MPVLVCIGTLNATPRLLSRFHRSRRTVISVSLPFTVTREIPKKTPSRRGRSLLNWNISGSKNRVRSRCRATSSEAHGASQRSPNDGNSGINCGRHDRQTGRDDLKLVQVPFAIAIAVQHPANLRRPELLPVLPNEHSGHVIL